MDCIYIDVGVSATTPQVTTTVNNLLSQAVYGIKQDSIDLGYRGTNAGTTTYRDTQLNLRSWPQASSRRASGTPGLLHVDCLGFFHTLEWETYRQTGNNAVQLTTWINTIRAAVANGATFFDNTDTRDIGTNTTTLTENKTRAQTVWDIFKEIREQGDGTNYWAIGITPTELGTGKRRLYWRAANSAIQYTALQRDGLRIRNIFRQPIPPWLVRPDCGIKLADFYIGDNNAGDNPTETYVMVVDYDANSQTATWQGDDDRTAEGIFNFRRYRKAPVKRFAPSRLL